LPGFLNYLSDFLGAHEPIRNTTGGPIVIFAVAGEEGNFRSSPKKRESGFVVGILKVV
jgi:hypothetical protein